MEVRIVEREPVPVNFVRHTGPYPECGKAWEKLCAWAGPRGLMANCRGTLGICYDDPKVTPPDKIRYDACLVTPDPQPAEGEIGLQEVAGGTYATATHKGPYDQLSGAWEYMYGSWMAASGYQPRNFPAFEAYHNDPNTTPPEELVTELFIPIEKA